MPILTPSSRTTMSDRKKSGNSSSSITWVTEQYVEDWQNGHAEALGALCQRFSPLVRYRIRNSTQWATLNANWSLDDLVQEVWARILGSDSTSFTPSGKGSFAAWLGRLTDSTLTDLIRRKQALKRGGGQEHGDLDTQAEKEARLFPGAAIPESPTGEARFSEFERVAGQVLNERELKAWKWVALLGYTSEETAMGLSTTPAAVRSLLVRSRAKLQKALGPTLDKTRNPREPQDPCDP